MLQAGTCALMLTTGELHKQTCVDDLMHIKIFRCHVGDRPESKTSCRRAHYCQQWRRGEEISALFGLSDI